MSDVVGAKKFDMLVVREKPAQQESPRNAASSQVKFNLHSCYYRDFFLLRTPITINGRPAVIKVVNGDPVFRVTPQPGSASITVKLSTITEQAMSPVLKNHGDVEMFYHEQVALYSLKFRSKSSLKQFLTDKEAVQKELESAIIKVCDLEAKQQLPSQSPSMLQLSVDMKVYLVCPPQSGVESSPDVHEVTLANYPSRLWMWQKSEMFSFSSAMFENLPGDRNAGCQETAELADLQIELKEVISWFGLGVQLRIPEAELLAIRKDHRDQTEDCRLEMLVKWGQLETPTWSKLVGALVNIGRRGLAERIADKYGLPKPFQAYTVLSSDVSVSSEISQSEQKLSSITTELEQARDSKNVTTIKLQSKLADDVPVLQKKLKKLTKETVVLRKQLKHRNKELKMLAKMQQSADQDDQEELQLLVEEKNRQIKSLQDELKLKETELDASKKQLREKENELTRMMKEMSAKSERVLELEEELERLRRSFTEQQREANKKMIEASAKSVSHEAYIKEIQMQWDSTTVEAEKMKEEIKSHNQDLFLKEKEISSLSEKIAEQEREMERLRKESDSRHRTPLQPSAENTNEDDERAHQLLISTIQLKLELRKAEEEKSHQKLDLETAKYILGKHERDTELENQERDTESVTLSQKRPKPPPVKEKPAKRKMSPVKKEPQSDTALLQHQQTGKKIIQTPLSEPKLPLNLKWNQGSNLPLGMSEGPSVVVMKGKVYVGGGDAASDKERQTVLVYNPHDDAWNQLPLYEYEYFTMTVINETQLVLVGGIHPTRWDVTNKLGVWNESRHQWMEQLPLMMTARCAPSVYTYKQWLLVAGGVGKQDRLSKVEILDVSTRQWYQVTSLPVAGHTMSSAVIGNMWYIMGGYTGKGNKSVMSVCIEDLISQAISQPAGANSSTSSPWNILPDTPLVRSTALAFQGALLAVGGYPNYSSLIYLYQPSTREWVKAGDMPTGRNMCGCTVLPSGHIIIAGGWAEDGLDIGMLQ